MLLFFFVVSSHTLSVQRNPQLAWALLSSRNQQQSLKQVSFYVEQDPAMEKITRHDMIDKLKNIHDAQQISAKIRAATTNIHGTPAYWLARRGDVTAMMRAYLFTRNQLPMIFCSGSMAEYQWPELKNAHNDIISEYEQDLSKFHRRSTRTRIQTR